MPLPEVSTYSREFKALRDPGEIAFLQSVMGLDKVRHNWLEINDFAVGMLVCQLGEIAFVNNQGTSATVWQDGIAADLITISRVNEGGSRMTLTGDTIEVSAGDVFLSAAGNAFEAYIPDYQNVSVISIPGQRLRQLGVPESMLRPRVELAPPGSAADVLLDFFHSFARRAESGPALSPRALAGVHESLAAMAAATLEENMAWTGSGVRSAAVAFIETHLHDPELSPATIAAALHVSTRTLYRSFTDQGVAAYIRAARLRRVKSELDAGRGAVSIGDVAGRWGFTNRGQFAKLFRSQFGAMPSDYLRNPR